MSLRRGWIQFVHSMQDCIGLADAPRFEKFDVAGFGVGVVGRFIEMGASDSRGRGFRGGCDDRPRFSFCRGLEFRRSIPVASSFDSSFGAHRQEKARPGVSRGRFRRRSLASDVFPPNTDLIAACARRGLPVADAL